VLTFRGIGVDSFVKVDADCPVTYEITGEQAQFRFGSVRSTGLTLIFTERSLETLIATGTTALLAMRAESSYDKGVIA